MTRELPDATINLGCIPETRPSQAALDQLTLLSTVKPMPLSTVKPMPTTSRQYYLVFEALHLIALTIEAGLHPPEAHAVLAASALKLAVSPVIGLVLIDRRFGQRCVFLARRGATVRFLALERRCGA